MKKVFFAFVTVATLALVSCNNAPKEETPAATEETAAPAAEEAAPAATEAAPAVTDSPAVAPAAAEPAK